MKKIKEFINYLSTLYIGNLAAAITFYMMFMLIPLTSLITNILGYLNIPPFSPDEYLVRNNIISIIFFVISIIFVSSKAVNSLTISTNIIYSKKENKSFFKRKIFSSILMLAFIILVIIQIILGVFIAYFFKEVIKIKFYFLINILYLFLSISFVSSIVYKYIIPVKIKLKKTFFMSMVITVLSYTIIIIFNLLIKLFMNNSYNNLYGAASALMLFMMLLYMIVYVYLIGIAFNYYFSKKR